MPIYEYRVKDGLQGCVQCAKGFDQLQRISDPPLTQCPKCGAAVERLISVPAVGGSKSALDDRARQAGFHKLQRLGRGEYEKKY